MDGNKALLIFFLFTTVVEAIQQRGIFGFFSKPPAQPTSDIQPYSKTCQCACGKRNEGGRIVGGDTTAAHEYPWMVRLSYLDRFYCGGTLINDRYILTAAHCIKGFMWFLIKVTLGEHDRCNKDKKPETRFVLRASVGTFTYFNFENDIAVLRLNDRVPISDSIRPICLPKFKGDHYTGKLATVAGWGTNKEEGGILPCTLNEVQLPVMTNDECKKSNYSESMISDNMMCAGYPIGQKDSCQGDSGGPLFLARDDKRYEVIGVVSWGHGCARPGFPGVYTRVAKYIDWIVDHAKDGCFCTADEDS